MHDILKNIKALADETRLRLAHILWHHELSVNELVTLLGMGQSRVSRHLKILADAGLLQARRDGLWVFYKATNTPTEHDFLEHIFNITSHDHTHNNPDLNMAEKIIEERAMKTRQFFNSIADNWDELNKEVLGNFSLPEYVKKQVPQNCPVAVDLGCGTGEVLEHLLSVSQNVIGVDGSPRMLELARRRFNEDAHKHLSLRIGELDHLPLRNEEANFACINLVLHHLSEPQIALDEITRILAPNGILLICDFKQHKEETMRKTYGDRWLGFSNSTIHDLVNKAGLSLLHHTEEPVHMGLMLNMFIVCKQTP